MKSGFSLLELLCALTLVVALGLLGLAAFERVARKQQEVKCMANLRQFGVGIGLYASDHAGDWPIATGEPVRRNTSSAAYLQGHWFGIGMTYAYLKDKRFFLCPLDDIYPSQQLKNWDHPTSDLWGSYALRGFGQTYGQEMSRKLGGNSGRALLSCTFMYSPRSSKPRFAFHEDQHPVLFGDGSVAIIGIPTWIDPRNPPNIWDTTREQFLMWDWFDSQR